MSVSGQALEPAVSQGRRRARGPFENLRRGFHKWWFAYAMLAPVMIVMGLLVFYPLVRGIMLSFTDADRFTLGNKYVPSAYDYVGLRNYKDILTSSDFRRVAEFSLIWTFVNVFFHFTIGLVLAVTLNRADPVPRRLPDAADGSVGGAVVHLGLRLALHLQQPVRVPRPVPGRSSAGTTRRRSSAIRPGQSSP